MNLKIALTAFVILSSIYASAQADFKNGFIVKTNGDTTIGFISNLTTSNSLVKFREKWSEPYQILSPKEIHSFGVEGEYLYRSVALIDPNFLGELIFYEVLLESQISLFYAGDFWILLPNGQFNLLQRKDFAKGLSSILSGSCLNKFVLRATKLSWTKSELLFFFRDCNDCMNGKSKIYFSTRKNLYFGGGSGTTNLLSSGLDSSRPDLGIESMSSAVDYFFFVNSNLPNIHRRIRLQMLIDYSPNHSFLIDHQEGNSFYETRFNLNLIQLEGSLRYQLNLGNRGYISPGLGFGLMFFHVINKSRTIETLEGMNVFTTDGADKLVIANSLITLNGLLAVGYHVTPSNYLFIESRAGLGKNFIVIDQNRLFTLSGRVGIGFKL